MNSDTNDYEGFGDQFESLKVDKYRHQYLQYRFLKRLVLKSAGALADEEEGKAADGASSVWSGGLAVSGGGLGTSGGMAISNAMTQTTLGGGARSGGTVEEMEVLNAFDTELQRLADFVKSKLAEFSSVFSYLLHEAVMLLQSSLDEFHRRDRIAKLQSALDQSDTDIGELSLFVQHNVAALYRLLNFHDIVSRYKVSGYFMGVKLVNSGLAAPNWTPLLLRLSETRFKLRQVYLKYPQDFAMNESDQSVSVADSSFTFWVHPEHAFQVKLQILQHLPIYVKGVQQDAAKSLENTAVQRDRQVEDSLSMNSLFFDQLPDLPTFHHRIEDSGYQSLRFRWYSKPDSAPQRVILEIKRSNGTQAEEFDIKFAKLQEFLSGGYNYEKYLRKRVKQNLLTNADAESQMNVARRVLELNQANQLIPLSGFTCRRSRFRFSDDDRVRISFDTRLDFFPTLDSIESAAGLEGLIRNVSTVRSRQRFPFAVLEIRLKSAADCPRWVADLMNSPQLMRAGSFSKFQHAMALFYPTQVRELPSWMSNPGMTNITRNSNLLLSHALPSFLARAVEGQATSSVPADDPGSRALHVKILAAMIDSNRHAGDQQPSSSSHAPVAGDAAAAARGNAYTRLSTGRSSGGPGQAEDREESRGPENSAAIRRPPKVEPKTLFANERTLLQWLNSTVIMASVAVTLVSLPGTARFAGMMLSPLAIVIGAYALFVYHRRRRAILGGNASTDTFEDPIGPYILVPLLILSVTSVAVYNYLA